jgi:hypothetical protein
VRVSEERWVRNGESEKGEWSMCVVCMNSREHMKRKGKKAGAGRNRRKTKKKSPFVSVTSEKKKRSLLILSLSLSFRALWVMQPKEDRDKGRREELTDRQTDRQTGWKERETQYPF